MRYCKCRHFAQYIFLGGALDVRKFEGSENYNHNRTNRIR